MTKLPRYISLRPSLERLYARAAQQFGDPTIRPSWKRSLVLPPVLMRMEIEARLISSASGFNTARRPSLSAHDQAELIPRAKVAILRTGSHP